MHFECPSGFFIKCYPVWGDPGSGAILSRLYDVQLPDMSASDDNGYTALESKLRLMVSGGLKIGDRMQVQLYTTCDHTQQLDRYAAQPSDIEICTKVRGELVSRFRKRMSEETLIKATVRISLSRKMPPFIKEHNGKSVKGFEQVFRVMSRSFDHTEHYWNAVLSSSGGSVKALDNDQSYDELLKFWSPSQARQPRFKDLNWMRPIDQLCRFSGLSPRVADHGFYMDGYYFGLVVAKSFPRGTHTQTMDAFLALTVSNVRVVLNIQPLSVTEEMQHERDRYGKLATNVDPKSPDPDAVVGMETHIARLAGLMMNKIAPFKAQLIAIACDKTPEGLDAKLQAVRAALDTTQCESWQPALPTATIALFNCATPAYGPWVGYDFWEKVNDSINIANLWPAGSTPQADLDKADWITDGACNNLIGGTMFTGAQPNHALVAGSTGYTKTSLVQSIALQTAPQFRFIVIIDDGLSWVTTCRRIDPNCTPIIVRADGSVTFNPLDTLGLPRSAQHQSSATALCHLLVGTTSDEDKDKLRHAILSSAINRVYDSVYKTWRNANPHLYDDLCQRTASVLEYQEEHSCESFLDAFLESKGLDLPPSELLLGRDPKTEHFVRDLGFAFWTPAMFPTLTDVHDELYTASLEKGPHQELLAILATLLEPWLRDGLHGPLVDGIGNVDLGSVDITEDSPLKVVHFELEKISKADSELRAVVGFLLANEVRNHIQGMPRGIRKLVVIEEMNAFLKVPNGAEIVLDYYERMRKYSAQVISVFQSYSTLLEANPKVAKALVSNSSNMFLLGNPNRSDVQTLSKFMPQPIPEVVQDHICGFPKPCDLPRDEAYGGFVYVQLGGSQPRYTVGRNFISDLVEQITSSSGSDFAAKQQEMRNARKENNNGNSNGALNGVRVAKVARQPYGR